MSNHPIYCALGALAFATLAFAPLAGIAETSGVPVEINVVLGESGQAAFLGREEMQTLQLVEQTANAQTGVRGRPVHFVFSDDTSKPQIGVSLVSDLVAKGAQVVIGPSGTNVCEAVFPVIQASARVAYCLSPAVHHPGSYMFSASTDVVDLAAVALAYLRSRGWTRVGVLVTTDDSGRSFEDAYRQVAALRENAPIDTVAFEHMGPTDLSAAAQIARIKAAGVQAVVIWTLGAATGTMLRNIADSGLDVPVVASSANMTIQQMTQYGPFLPKELYFPFARSANYDATASAPLSAAQQLYFGAYGRAGIHPDSGTTLAWDPAFLIIAALNRYGPEASGAQIRDFIEQLHGWAGINGYYDFRDGRQRGLLRNSAIMLRWDPAKRDFVAMSKPGGLP